MPQTIQFFHAGCPVCVNAENRLADAIDTGRYTVERIHLGERPDRLADADAAGVRSVPAFVIDGQALHVDFGASIDDLR